MKALVYTGTEELVYRDEKNPSEIKGESILKIQSERNLNYTSLIRELSDKVKKSSRIWLSRISKKVRDVIIC